MHLFIQQMFVECLLWARYSSGHWGHSSEQNYSSRGDRQLNKYVIQCDRWWETLRRKIRQRRKIGSVRKEGLTFQIENVTFTEKVIWANTCRRWRNEWYGYLGEEHCRKRPEHGTGAKVRAALACMKASRRLIWLGKNGKKSSKIWGPTVGEMQIVMVQ